MHTIVINMNMLDENIHNIWYIYIYIYIYIVWGEHGIVKELINILNIKKFVE